MKSFCTNVELLNNINRELPLCSIVTSDFNASCSRWWKNDITNLQGQELTLSAGYNQIIDKATHVINTSMSCIDLIFCTNQSVISNHRVDVPIFDKCHHNIICGKINIRVPVPPTYVREVWDYEKANIENIKKALIGIKLLANVVPVHERENKMLVKNYRPISLLPIFGKVFKELNIVLFSTIFKAIYFSHLPNLVFFQEIHLLVI